MVGNGACANLRSLAVPLGGCCESWCEFFAGSLCEGRLQMVGNRAREKCSEVEISRDECSEVEK